MKRNVVVAAGLAFAVALVLHGCVSRGPGSDFDADGVRDDLEDSNDNFLFDQGEIDFLNPDSDLDGLCDGQPPKPLTNCTGCEDCNNNGLWEPCLGENDPLNDDTDNDGIPDKSDPVLDVAQLGIDCSQGNVQLPYGTSLPPGKPFPQRPTPTPTPAPFPTSTAGPTPTLIPNPFFTPTPVG